MAVKNYKPLEINIPREEKTPFDPSKQTEGFKKRLEGSGVDVDKALDSRNWLEKTLNLTPDQNTLFDIFEILERPQRALFGAIEANQTGKDVKEGLKKGISGNDVVKFKEILHNAGVQDTGEKFGADDVAGFLGEVFLDPIDLALIPVTGGANLAVKAGVEGAQTGVKATKYISTLDLLGRGLKKGIKGSANVSDNLIKNVLTKVDDINLKKIEEGIAEGSLKGVKTNLELSKGYKNFKHNIVSIFNASKALPKGVIDAVRKNTGNESLVSAKLKIRLKNTLDTVDDYAAKVGRNSDDVGKDMMEFIEYRDYKPTTTTRALMESRYRRKVPLDIKTRDRVKSVLESVGVKFDDVYKKKRLKNGRTAFFVKNETGLSDAIKKLDSQFDTLSPDMVKLLDEEIANPRWYSPQDMTKYNEWSKDKDFVELVDFAKTEQDDMLALIDDALGVNLKVEGAGGYLRHSATLDRKNIPRKLETTLGDFSPTQLKGNTNTLTGRQYQMSAKEANEVARDNIEFLIENDLLNAKQKEFWSKNDNVSIFEETIQASMSDFIDKTPKFAKSVKMMDDVLVKSFMENPELVRGLEEGSKIPRGFQGVSREDLVAKMKKFSQYTEGDAMKNSIKNLPKDKVIIMDNNIYDAIGRLGTTKDVNVMVKALDTINMLFKKNKLLSPGFQMRNAVGNFTNMYLAGVPIPSVVKNFKAADNVLRQGDELLEKSMKGAKMTKREREMLTSYEEFVGNNFHDVGSKLWDLPEDIAKNASEGKKNVFQKVSSLNAKANEEMDKRYRLALLMYAKKNPEVYQKVGVDSAPNFVRRVLFDPNDLSLVEKDIVKKTVPFYTFAKKNLAFQMENLIDNPVRYKRLKKTIGQIWESQGIDEKDIEGYKRENFWIPIPGLTKDGKYTALKVNLPLGDLADFLDSPLKKIASSVSPGLRAPFELATNKQVFTGRPISDFEGQRGFQIPELSRKAEYGLGQIGLDVPFSFGADIGRTIGKAAQGQTDLSDPFSVLNESLGRSVTSSGSVQKAQTARDYEELNQVRDLMSYYKQESVPIYTVAELENKNQTLDALQRKLRSLLN